MADRPVGELDGLTPLQAARTPNMDRLAREGSVGMAKTLPEGLPNGSDVANLGILGYDPRKYYTGRAPLEAASMGIRLESGDVAFRCNFVTLDFNPSRPDAVMVDHSAGQLATEEGHKLIEELNRRLAAGGIRFYPGVSYRNIMLWAGGEAGLDCTPPHDILGKKIREYLPKGKRAEVVKDLMRASVDILEAHPVNKGRVAGGKRPANSIWLWGQGGKPELPPFAEVYGLKGAMVSAVDLAKGLAASAGLEVINVPGATGYLDTNYEGKAIYALQALEKADFVYVHVEAPDEASHEGKLEEKIKAIEDFDAKVVGTVLEGIGRFPGGCRILVMPDHATPLEARTHTQEPVPFIVYDSTGKGGGAKAYDESIGSAAGVLRIDAHNLMRFLLEGEV